MALDAVGQAAADAVCQRPCQRGREQIRVRRFESARAALARAVEQQPTNIDYLYEYGRVLIELGVDNSTLYQTAIDISEQR